MTESKIRARFRVYIAASVDGYIATPDGGVEWLEAFEGADFGYGDFFASIDTIVMGRASFDQVLGFGEWPYPGKPSIVLTHRAPPQAEIPGLHYMKGEMGRVADEILARAGGDIWIMGGAETIRGFLAAGRVDTFEVFTMPVLLGRGIPLFLASDCIRPLNLVESRTYANGVVLSSYSLE